MRAREFINEAQREGRITKRQQQATKGVNTFTDGEHWNGDYTHYRVGIAAACTDGKFVPDMNSKSWIGKSKAAFPYTPEDQEILKRAYEAAGASYQDLNNGDMDSEELKTTNSVSPVAARKKNRYGV